MKYMVTVDIVAATGTVSYIVDASSKEEAFAKYKAGGAVFHDEYVESETADDGATVEEVAEAKEPT